MSVISTAFYAKNVPPLGATVAVVDVKHAPHDRILHRAPGVRHALGVFAVPRLWREGLGRRIDDFVTPSRQPWAGPGSTLSELQQSGEARFDQSDIG